MGFESKTLVFQRTKTDHASDLVASGFSYTRHCIRDVVFEIPSNLWILLFQVIVLERDHSRFLRNTFLFDIQNILPILFGAV
jgi:hypothetical protein